MPGTVIPQAEKLSIREGWPNVPEVSAALDHCCAGLQDKVGRMGALLGRGGFWKHTQSDLLVGCELSLNNA